ncbi:MAG: M4 family metallopeptidase [Dysgonamonadaceae bacterium]|nr:M4 family metallopeptidase [Dysgonamonadaceae bacterium]
MNKYLISLILMVFYCMSNAQNKEDIQHSRAETIRFARFQINADSDRKMQNDTSFLKSVLIAKEEDSFRKVKDYTDELGITHKRFQQYYKGLKVENAEYLIHGKEGNIEVINGDFQNINIPTIEYSLDEQKALEKALTYVGAQKYKWEDAGMEKFVKMNTDNSNATCYPKGELLISEDFLTGSNTFRLSWKFTISSMIPDNEQMIYVAADNGEIINDVSLICDANVSCTAQTLYSGTQAIMGDTYSAGGIRLQETRNSVIIQTRNLNKSYDPSSATDFRNNSTYWTYGNWATFNQNRCALDAHWGAEKVLDYWRNVFARNSIDNNGLRVLSYVHTSTNWANAQWVSGTGNNYMRYGDGDGTTFKPLTALDICAHEFGHGITQFTAQLAYNNQESGALNEGFSDIWGACIEYWAAPSKQTWLMGEEIFKTTTYNCIRNLQNPKSTIAAEGQHPNTYHGNFWSNSGEPHCNSTVLSHWFYLLSQGGSGTNDLGNTYSVAAISISKAQRIAYRALANYLHSSAAYSDARNTTIQAAIDLYGDCSPEVISTTNAWYAVGVGNEFTSTVNFINQTVTTNTTVTSCGDINVQNVTVTNGAKLTLDAAGEVNIISDFEVELGSEFEIIK